MFELSFRIKEIYYFQSKSFYVCMCVSFEIRGMEMLFSNNECQICKSTQMSKHENKTMNCEIVVTVLSGLKINRRVFCAYPFV